MFITSGRYLKRLREEKKLSRSDVAKHLGISKSHVANMELDNARIGSTLLLRWVSFLGGAIKYAISINLNDVRSLRKDCNNMLFTMSVEELLQAKNSLRLIKEGAKYCLIH